MKDSRILWIDILKCFAILTVVVGHMVSCGAFASRIGTDFYQEFILAFHMPLFTVLSGWFFSAKRTPKEFLGAKSISILLPYLVWCLLWFFVLPLILLIITGKDFHLSTIIWQMTYFFNDALPCYGWWFLRGLFFTMLLAYASVKVVEKCGKAISDNAYLCGGIVSTVLLYGLTFAGVIPNQPDKDSLLKGFIYMYPFFWVGYGFRQLSQRYTNKMFNTVSLVSVWSFFIIGLIIWDGVADPFYAMNTSISATVGANGIVGMTVIYKTLFRFVVGAIGSLAFILLFERLFQSESQNNLRQLCQNVGKETLGIYILQSLVYWSLPDNDILGFGEIGNFCFALFISFVIVFVAYHIIRISSKNKWLGLFLWGKKMI